MICLLYPVIKIKELITQKITQMNEIKIKELITQQITQTNEFNHSANHPNERNHPGKTAVTASVSLRDRKVERNTWEREGVQRSHYRLGDSV
jgi:hypothetical protein